MPAKRREYVEESYDLMKYDDNSWLYNIHKVCQILDHHQQAHLIAEQVIHTFKTSKKRCVIPMAILFKFRMVWYRNYNILKISIV